VALTIPYFSDFMTLLGSLGASMLIFVFPVIFDFRLYGFSNRSSKDIGQGILILCMGALCAVIGGMEAITALWKDFHGQ